MTLITETFTEEIDLVIYAHPRPNLATWNIAGPTVLCSQSAAPNKGLYTITYDDAVATIWGLFIGATPPGNWSQQIGQVEAPISSEGGGGTTNVTLCPQVFVNIDNTEVEDNELILYNSDPKTILFTLLEGTFGNVALKFILENDLGVNLATVTGLTSATNTLSVAIPAVVYTNQPCNYRWSIRKVSNDELITYGPAIMKYAAI
jgi:hypothetical protein